MTIRNIFFAAALAAGAGLLAPSTAFAHCDSLDGPVVKAAERALQSGDVNHVLVWIQADGEAEIRAAFASTLAVRGVNAQAKALADRYFFETVVRIHRRGEGEPYTGLRPAGEPTAPAIALADRALAAGTVKQLSGALTSELSAGLQRRFLEVAEARLYDPADVAAGRNFVKAYVEYIHYVERLHEVITAAAAHGHAAEIPPR